MPRTALVMRCALCSPPTSTIHTDIIKDPYFEHVQATDANGRPYGKARKQKKPVPEGISAHDAKVLTKVKRRAYRLDNAINVCGIKFGWSSVIGLIPAAGDFVDFFMACKWFISYFYHENDG